MIKGIVLAVWTYIREMNTGTNGKLSINRNMSWGIASLMIFVEVYSLWRLPYETDNNIAMYIKLCIVYVLVDACFVALALRITSVEKINELAQTIKGGFPFKRNDPRPEDSDPKVIVNTQTETEVKTQP